MTGKRGRPRKSSTPSWQRDYRERNPTISMVGTPLRKKLLDTIRGERSYGKTFEDFMNGKLKPAEALAKELAKVKKTIALMKKVGFVVLPNGKRISLEEYIERYGVE